RRRGDRRLAYERRGGLGVPGQRGRQQFQRDLTAEAAVLGTVDHAHATTAELFGDFIVRECPANHSEREIISWRAVVSSCTAVNILLLSMPDSFEHMPPIAVRMPNGALASLAANVDAHHRVSIADLILVQSSVRATLERLVRDLQPDVVGFSVTTFQRATALALAAFVRQLRPSARVV